MGGSRRLLTAVAGAAAIALGTAGAGYGVYDAWQQEQQEQQQRATTARSGADTAERGENRSRASTTPGDGQRAERDERTPTPRRDAEPTPTTPTTSTEKSDGSENADENDASPERTPKQGQEPGPEQTSDAGDAERESDTGKGGDGSDGPAPEVTALSSERAQYEAEVIRLTNAERAEHGCDKVQANDALTKAARGHSTDMAERGYFAHTSPDGETPWDRMREAGYYQPAAENIAKGQPGPAAVVQAWMDSEGHRRNILNCSYESIGVGVYLNEGPYWTQNFGYE